MSKIAIRNVKFDRICLVLDTLNENVVKTIQIQKQVNPFLNTVSNVKVTINSQQYNFEADKSQLKLLDKKLSNLSCNLVILENK